MFQAWFVLKKISPASEPPLLLGGSMANARTLASCAKPPIRMSPTLGLPCW